MYQLVVISLCELDSAEQLEKRIVRKSTRCIGRKTGGTPLGMSKAMALPERLYFGLQLIDIDHPIVAELLAQSQPVVRNRETKED
jgi:hypothetical protein